jgi:hypothetical protein
MKVWKSMTFYLTVLNLSSSTAEEWTAQSFFEHKANRALALSAVPQPPT